MTTQTEQLKAFIEQAKTQVASGLISQSEIDRYEAQLKYTVAAGGWDGDDISTDYIDSFVSIEDALEACKKYGSDQPWSRIELRDGDFVYEIEPIRIMRRDPETGYFNRCADDGDFIREQVYELSEQDHADSEKAYVNNMIDSIADSGEYKMDAAAVEHIVCTLPMEIVNEAVRMNGFADLTYEDGIKELSKLPVVMVRRDLHTAVRNLED